MGKTIFQLGQLVKNIAGGPRMVVIEVLEIDERDGENVQMYGCRFFNEQSGIYEADEFMEQELQSAI